VSGSSAIGASPQHRGVLPTRRRALSQLRAAWLAAQQTIVAGWQDDWAQRFNWMPVLVGVGVGIYFALPVEPRPLLSVLALLPLIAYVVARALDAPQAIIVAAACITAIGAGFAIAIVRTQTLSTAMLAEETSIVDVSGQVMSAEPGDKNRTRVVLDSVVMDPAPEGPSPTRVRLSLANAPSWVKPGEWLTVRAILRPLPAPVAPGSYDFARTLWFDGIGAVGFSMGDAERIQSREPDGLIERFSMWMASVRQTTSDRIRDQLDARSGPIAAAFLTGERALISESDQQAMRDSSLAHLLSISGLHMALAGFGFLSALRFIFALIPVIALNYPVKKWAAVAALLASFGYLMLSGSSIPAVRSFVMIAVAFISIIVDRPAISMRVVALSALVILIFTPESWIDPSFQMSFAAVVGLVSAFEWWARRKNPVAPTGLLSRGLGILGATAATSLVAGFASAPFAAYHFNRFANYGIAANLLAMPVVSFVIMPAGVVALLAMPLGLDGPPLQLMGWGINVMLDIAHWVAAWPGASLRVTTIPNLALVLMVAGGLWIALWQSMWRVAGIALVAIGFIASFFGVQPDLIVAGDGRNFAVRGADGRLYLLSARRGVFGAEQWLKRDADPREVKAARATQEVIACSASACTANINGRADRKLLYVLTSDAFAKNCDGAVVVIDQSSTNHAQCGAAGLTISYGMLEREGAVTVSFSGNALKWTSAARERGRRPWSVH
jgi:competence protein ComEC